MDLLETAVVDITLLLATSRALRDGKRADDAPQAQKGRRRLRAELKRGAVAYLDALARGEQGIADSDLLAMCRIAAEMQMPQALDRVGDLRAMMQAEPGALDGFAPARHDLWRLSRMAIHLRRGAARRRPRAGEAWPPAGDGDSQTVHKTAKRLGKRLRRALVAYARASMRGDETPDRTVSEARRAAMGELGARGIGEAAKLARFEIDVARTPGLIEKGVARPLSDLLLDWGGAGT